MAQATAACTFAPTKQVFYEAGGVHNCYCSNVTSARCTPVATSWLAAYTQPESPPPSLVPTSTGVLYTSKRY